VEPFRGASNERNKEDSPEAALPMDTGAASDEEPPKPAAMSDSDASESETPKKKKDKKKKEKKEKKKHKKHKHKKEKELGAGKEGSDSEDPSRMADLERKLREKALQSMQASKHD